MYINISSLLLCRHGITHEPDAVKEYGKVLRCLGHDIQVSCSGLFVDPASPWLGASPDRVKFDPTEAVLHGVVEVKCPYTMRLAPSPDVRGFYMVKDSCGVYRLNHEHNYYFQLLGRMALSGLSWGDFAVYTKHFLIVERIP